MKDKKQLIQKMVYTNICDIELGDKPLTYCRYLSRNDDDIRIYYIIEQGLGSGFEFNILRSIKPCFWEGADEVTSMGYGWAQDNGMRYMNLGDVTGCIEYCDPQTWIDIFYELKCLVGRYCDFPIKVGAGKKV